MKSFFAAVLLVGCAANAPKDGTQLSQVNAGSLYQLHCASCHGGNRMGVMGPALIPETLQKMKAPEIQKVILDGRPATQMAGYSKELSSEEARALADYLLRPVEGKFSWTQKEIDASRETLVGQVAPKPVFQADPMNLFFVVSHGDHGLTVLDGDRFTTLAHFPMRPGLHGGVKYTPDGRFAFTTTRDGWVTKFDVWGLKKVAEVRAGLNARNIAVSGDGKYVAVANQLPHTLVILRTSDLGVARVVDLVEPMGRSSRASAVYSAPPRKTFVLALKDLPELWEIAWKDFSVRRIPVEKPLDDFFFDHSYAHALAASRDSAGGFVVDLKAGKVVGSVELTGMPHLGSGILWRDGRDVVMATPNIKEGVVTAVNTTDWTVRGKVTTKGPGFFLRSHEKTPYAWVDNFMSKDFKDVVQVIDKKSLKVVKELQPRPGKVTAHVEFTRDGRYALLSVWDDDGALLVYDAKNFRLVREIPMKKPSGKYNVWNKTRLSEGTSH